MVDIISPLYRFLAEGEVIVATDEHIRDDGSTWEPVNSWAVGMEYPSKVFKSIRRIAQPAQSWQPIETAPKTGEEIIARTGAGWPSFSCFWRDGRFLHIDADDGYISYSPTEWMPFPAADSTPSSNGGDHAE